jgi:hypothetical protein
MAGMRSLSRLLLVAGILSVLPFAAARAGEIWIYPQQDLGASTLGLYVKNSAGSDIGGVNILVTGATGFSFDPGNLNISLPDSGFISQALPPFDALIVNGTAGPFPTLFNTIAPAGATTRLGTFTSAGSPTGIVLYPGETVDPDSGDTAFLASFFDNAGQPFIGHSMPLVCGEPPCEFTGGVGFVFATVPEPFALPLLATLAFAAYVLGGKIRRRSGSVRAPT